MWIYRDLEAIWPKVEGLPTRILIGPRQCGKSALLEHLAKGAYQIANLDDLQTRTLLQNDPALYLAQNPPPILIEEAQYAPNLFPEIKRLIDTDRSRKRRGEKTLLPQKECFWLTGSNQTLLNERVRESLAGRATYFKLFPLSIKELGAFFENFDMNAVWFKGGWPELYVTEGLDPSQYLNDYISTYVEKDIVLASGIEKLSAFSTSLTLFAARTGQILNASEIGRGCGVKSVTIEEWLGTLQTNDILSLVYPYSKNLNKRMTKRPKIYFNDVALAVRLQGWSDITPLLRSPQMGPLFETLVFTEILKTQHHYLKKWKIYFWRTKEGEEIDFIIQAGDKYLALEAKLGIQSIEPVRLPKSLHEAIPEIKELILVNYGGEVKKLSPSCAQVPLKYLTNYLLEHL